MNLRLYNAQILTMEKDREIFSGEVWIRNDRIALVEEDGDLEVLREERALPHINWEVEIDCHGNLLMPGLKDAHTHSPMTFLRSFAEDKPTQDWLKEDVFPREEKLTEEDIYDFGKLAVMEYVSGGITSIFDMYLMPRVMAQVAVDTGMRCVLVPGLNDFTSSIREMEREFRDLNRFHPLVSYKLGFHAEYTCSKELLYQISSLAHGLRQPVYCHLSETKAEVESSLKRNGVAPLEFLDLMGMFAYGGGGFHCVHLNRGEMDILKFRKMGVITNPASNLKLASGIAPLAEFEKRGVPIAIGTDGAASNNALDCFREMYLAATLAKLRGEDPVSIPAGRILEYAICGGAKVMGLEETATLTRGNLADLILIDLAAPNMQPSGQEVRNLVYSCGRSNVLMTVIGGKIVYRNGEYNIGDSPERILSRCKLRAKKLLS